ncbi:MAG: hypothetical protein OEU76_05755, partial [Cyclobacteriaceae bacterium]|nr:hypothetical protein [Cyclobacteriaceae bacterium]
MKQLLILIFLLSVSWSYAQKDPRTLTKEQWKEDILFLKEQIEKNHIDPFHFQNKQEWDKAFDDLEVALPDLTYQQIVSRIISLAASVGDGHTNARPYAALTRYPVTFQWFGEDLRIIRISKENSQVLGAKVLKVGGMKVKDAHNRLKTLIPAHESPTFVLGWSEYLFSLD